MVLEGTISGSTENLSHQGSLKNHFLKEFYKEPMKVSQRTFKPGFFKEPFVVPKEPSNQGSLKNHLWFPKNLQTRVL